jgi:multidrug resistance efflux pump
MSEQRRPATAVPASAPANGVATAPEQRAASPPAASPPAVGAAPASPAAASPPAAPSQPRRARRLVLAAVLLLALGGAGASAYRWWQDSQTYVQTDNAQLAGRLVQVGALTAGRVATVRYDVGQTVARDQVVAEVYVPVPVGTTSGGAPRLEFRPTSDALVEVRAPVDGVVVARGASPGDTVPAGQPLLTLVDPARLWVNANVEETQIRRVRRGQPVEVRVDALDQGLTGRVAAITPASAATFSLLPQQNLSGNFTKTTQLVPVKIELDQPDPRLMIGTSVGVRIRVAD